MHGPNAVTPPRDPLLAVVCGRFLTNTMVKTLPASLGNCTKLEILCAPPSQRPQ
jgi:hypothetical protein